ncbi:DUF5712 family protein [Mucilaginibacter litoreus]|uniref:DUF5712 family protein n=1 Tax=Mucilaginibacter litoreus TaxID=1048221 RepID=A0ABW3AUF9_9SPHI
MHSVKHTLKVGQFERVAFKQSAESLFNKLFYYPRNVG